MENNTEKKINLEALFRAIGYSNNIWKGQKSRALRRVTGNDGSKVFMASQDIVDEILASLSTGKSKYSGRALELHKKGVSNIQNIYSEYVEEKEEGNKPSRKKDLREALTQIEEAESLEDIAEILERIRY